MNPIIHSPLRLAVMTLLLTVDEADFNYLKAQTEATSGNLSIQLDKLKTAGYIAVTKEIVGKRTRTSCRITPSGKEAFEAYVKALKSYLKL